jgi:hypothetical protein
MDEYIFFAFTAFNETVAFATIEPFDCTLFFFRLFVSELLLIKRFILPNNSLLCIKLLLESNPVSVCGHIC